MNLKLQIHKANIQKSIKFISTINEALDEEIKKTQPILQLHQKE